MTDSIFPSLNEDLQEQLNTMETETSTTKSVGRSFLFDFDKGQFIIRDGKVVETTQLEAIEQWVNLCLRTYKDKFKVYLNTDFGCSIEDIISNKLTDFYESELKREIEEALLKSVYIESVEFTDITQNSSNVIAIELSITLMDGSIVPITSTL